VGVEETETRLEAGPEALTDTTDRVRAIAAAAEHPAWDPEVVAEVSVVVEVEVEAAVGAGKSYTARGAWELSMKSSRGAVKLLRVLSAAACALLSPQLIAAQESVAKPAPAAAHAKAFDTPQQAADALIAAAGKFDVPVLQEIFGVDGDDIIFSGEYSQDRQRALDFAAQAREKQSISIDPRTANRAFLLVGDEDWPFPVPLVKSAGKWSFDAKAGRQELLYRRIGSNELDAIDICHGYVEAQYEYALKPREGYDVNQYAQRIISAPGKQDGLAWQNPDGSWAGPIGEKIARVIERGYSPDAEPYHGYFFKILKGQGPAAPLGEMDYVVKGAMIGGFALIAAPAEYGETGIKSFMVSQDGVVYEKDLGPGTLDEFAKTERFNPDSSWTPVADDNTNPSNSEPTANQPIQEANK